MPVPSPGPKALDLLTTAQVCKALAISDRTLQRWVAQGSFPAPLKRSRRWVRWFRADVERFLGQLEQRRAP